MRRAAITLLVFLIACGVGEAQHKIPPIPPTAHAPVVLPSGLKYIDIKVGTGVPAVKGRMVRIAFVGWVTKTQLMFDFRDPPNPLPFHLGAPDPNVIPGLNEGVAGMRVGGQRRLIVPPRLGHGSRGTKLIPPNSELTYDVELVSVARPGV
jgi:FKBP-type peptidyl-prolyl cis-trans isomerase